MAEKMTKQNKPNILENLFFFLATGLALIAASVIMFLPLIPFAFADRTTDSNCFIGCAIIEARENNGTRNN